MDRVNSTLVQANNPCGTGEVKRATSISTRVEDPDHALLEKFTNAVVPVYSEFNLKLPEDSNLVDPWDVWDRMMGKEKK